MILSPVFPTAAPPHGEVENLDARYTNPHNLTGWPAATVRCGNAADGLPIGVQLAAHPWRDDIALAAAAAHRGRARRRTCRSPMTALPAGPTEPPALQTARWLARPIAFMEDCRRRYGDTFSVMFQGFKTPLVMVSSPEVIRALYAERGHNMPPGRTVTLEPLVGARSLLLLEGAEHLSRRKVMLPPFHGDRMRAYEPVMREATERELDAWPIGQAFAGPPEHAGDHARR